MLQQAGHRPSTACDSSRMCSRQSPNDPVDDEKTAERSWRVIASRHFTGSAQFSLVGFNARRLEYTKNIPWQKSFETIISFRSARDMRLDSTASMTSEAFIRTQAWKAEGRRYRRSNERASPMTSIKSDLEIEMGLQPSCRDCVGVVASKRLGS